MISFHSKIFWYDKVAIFMKSNLSEILVHFFNIMYNVVTYQVHGFDVVNSLVLKSNIRVLN